MKFLQIIGRTLLLATLLIYSASLIAQEKALAAAPQLDPNADNAKALAYQHESSDAAKSCVRCQFYTTETSDGWGHCVLFPDSLVNARGLCTSWYARA